MYKRQVRRWWWCAHGKELVCLMFWRLLKVAWIWYEGYVDMAGIWRECGVNLVKRWRGYGTEMAVRGTDEA